MDAQAETVEPLAVEALSPEQAWSAALGDVSAREFCTLRPCVSYAKQCLWCAAELAFSGAIHKEDVARLADLLLQRVRMEISMAEELSFILAVETTPQAHLTARQLCTGFSWEGNSKATVYRFEDGSVLSIEDKLFRVLKTH